MIREQTWLDIHSEASNMDVLEMLTSECESNVSKYWESESHGFTGNQHRHTLHRMVMGEQQHKPLHRRNTSLKKTGLWKHAEASDEQSMMVLWLVIWDIVQMHVGSHSHSVRRKPRDKCITKGGSHSA